MKIRWSKWKRILNFLTWMVFFLLIAVRMVTALGYEPYRILSGSMEPTLKIGEVVLINTNDTTVNDGDVIAFYMGEQVVIHRIQETVSDGVYITKGDANDNVDFSPVKEEEIIGRMWISFEWASLFWSLVTSNVKWGFIFVLVGLNAAAEIYENEKEDAVYE